jgi:hypothetical protein
MTKYIKKEDFERIIESSIDTVGSSFVESTIMKMIIGAVTMLFGAIFVAVGLAIFIGFIATLLVVILISSPVVIAELAIRKKA